MLEFAADFLNRLSCLMQSESTGGKLSPHNLANFIVWFIVRGMTIPTPINYLVKRSASSTILSIRNKKEKKTNEGDCLLSAAE
jgi:hypothetical protein